MSLTRTTSTLLPTQTGGEEDGAAIAAYFRSISEYPVLSPREIALLFRKFRKTKDRGVFEKIVLHNLRFVVFVAKKHIGQGLSFLELIQEGNIGLMKAVDRFKPELGNRLTSYAQWWIRQSIRRALDKKARMIRIPTHVLARSRRVCYASKNLAKKLGHASSTAEIAAATGEDEKFVDQSLHPVSAISLYAPSFHDNGFEKTLDDTIPDERAADPSSGADLSTMRDSLTCALATLTEREQEVLKDRFGFSNDGRALTLEKVGQKFGITRERVRQIEEGALRKLRTPSRLKMIRGVAD